MVDTCVSGAYGAIRAGSSPAFGIFCRKINRGKRRTIGFQDSLDAFLSAIMPNCWEFKADL